MAEFNLTTFQNFIQGFFIKSNSTFSDSSTTNKYVYLAESSLIKVIEPEENPHEAGYFEFVAIVPQENDNPKQKCYYIDTGSNTFVLSNDTTIPDPAPTYYRPQRTEDTTISSGKVYYKIDNSLKTRKDPGYLSLAASGDTNKYLKPLFNISKSSIYNSQNCYYNTNDSENSYQAFALNFYYNSKEICRYLYGEYISTDGYYDAIYVPVKTPEGNPKAQGWSIFTRVNDPSGISPKTQGWYESVNNDNYILSTDDEAESGKTYFTKSLTTDESVPTENAPIYYQLLDINLFSGSVNQILVVEPETTPKIAKRSYTVISRPTGDPSAKGWYDLIVVTKSTGNPQEQGWYELSNNVYLPSTDTSISGNKVYYDPQRTTDSFIQYTTPLVNFVGNPKSQGLHELEAVDDPSGQDPHSQGWYEFSTVSNPEGNPQAQGWYIWSDDKYVLTTDISVQEGTTYYELVITSDTSAVQSKTYYESVLTQDTAAVQNKIYYKAKNYCRANGLEMQFKQN